MKANPVSGPIEILLVEDNRADARLTIEALKESKVNNNLTVIEDGVEAMAYLRKEGKYADSCRPDMILLDLNLPGKTGEKCWRTSRVIRASRRYPW